MTVLVFVCMSKHMDGVPRHSVISRYVHSFKRLEFIWFGVLYDDRLVKPYNLYSKPFAQFLSLYNSQAK